MTTKNPYRKKSHFWTKQTRKIIRMFAEDLTASKTSNLLGIERRTINDRYTYIRHCILRYSYSQDKEIRKGIIEIDESYFWPRRVRWKRGRWAGDKIKVLGLLKRDEKVYCQIVPNCSASVLLPIIRGKIDPENSTMNTDGRQSYDGLVDLWYDKHYRVIHSENEFARGKQHVNGIESFRSYTKRRLAKFNGIKEGNFALHLKECEFRFNRWLQKENLYNKLLKILRDFTSSWC